VRKSHVVSELSASSGDPSGRANSARAADVTVTGSYHTTKKTGPFADYNNDKTDVIVTYTIATKVDPKSLNPDGPHQGPPLGQRHARQLDEDDRNRVAEAIREHLALALQN
jgi:hypothetical protein